MGRQQLETVEMNGGDGPAALRPLLEKTSRTFALSIPLLPEPLQTEVAVAYLLFRIIDTFEDATRWEPARRAKALAFFARVMDGEAGEDSDGGANLVAMSAAWSADPPLEHEGCLELLRATPEVVSWHRRLRPAAVAQLGRHVARSAREMAKVVGCIDGDGVLALETLQDLRAYCYAVAGLVGQMLTELFVLQCPSLERVADGLRARSVEFGEALQLVNILKDVGADASEGRVYLPRRVTPAEVFMLARADLRRAVEYTELLREGGAARGIVAFNALNTRLAIGTLRLLRDRGAGAKLSRLQVTGVAAEVMSAIDNDGVLFAESP
jgi:farnesyl-diphosphate farnesyltransferase